MSKLDWFTTLVIAVCVIAIGALIWNAKNLVQSNNKESAELDLSENHTDAGIAAGDLDETYDINLDGDKDGDNGANTNGAADGSSTISYDSDVAREAAEADAEEARMAEREAADLAREAAKVPSGDNATSQRINTNTSPNSNNSGISAKSVPSTTNSSSTSSSARAARTSEGKFLVLIGSYTQMISAERMLRSVRSKGYRSAQIEKFNNGKYARVLVDKRKSLNSARDLQAELVSDGFRDIIIKEK